MENKQSEIHYCRCVNCFAEVLSGHDFCYKHFYMQKDLDKARSLAGDVAVGTITTDKIGKLEDLINKPNHYHDGGIDVNALIEMKFPEHVKGFYLGNVLKYVIRHELKNGIQDLEKAAFNLNKLIEIERKK